VYVRDSPNAPQWHITCVYGEPRVKDRHRMWETLPHMKTLSSLPWFVVGDFNVALWQEEHIFVYPWSDVAEAIANDCLYYSLMKISFPRKNKI
jgi:hypothetical protein